MIVYNFVIVWKSQLSKKLLASNKNENLAKTNPKVSFVTYFHATRKKHFDVIFERRLGFLNVFSAISPCRWFINNSNAKSRLQYTINVHFFFGYLV